MLALMRLAQLQVLVLAVVIFQQAWEGERVSISFKHDAKSIWVMIFDQNDERSGLDKHVVTLMRSTSSCSRTHIN